MLNKYSFILIFAENCLKIFRHLNMKINKKNKKNWLLFLGKVVLLGLVSGRFRQKARKRGHFCNCQWYPIPERVGIGTLWFYGSGGGGGGESGLNQPEE